MGMIRSNPWLDGPNSLRKVNLIPYNHVEGLRWKRPDVATQETFLQGLLQLGEGDFASRKGHDIDAACGQLRLKVEREEPSGTSFLTLLVGWVRR